MKILVLTEGGHKTGFGHLSRCAALTQGISKFGMQAKTVFVVNGDKSGMNFLRRQSINQIIMSDWIKEKDEIINLAKKSDIVIVDSYLAPKALYVFIYKSIRPLTGKLICLDDYNRLDYPPSLVLNSSIYGNRVKYKIKPGSLYLLDKDYVILRKEFWNIPKKSIKKNVKDILITFGGVNYGRFPERLVRFISGKHPKFKYHFILPESNLSARAIIRLMLKCDICISSGGQTLHELARIGLPTIGICLSENQRLNLESWEEKGFLEYIGWYNNKDLLQNLDSSIRKLDDPKIRFEMSNAGRRFVDGQGVRRIIKEILTRLRGNSPPARLAALASRRSHG